MSQPQLRKVRSLALWDFTSAVESHAATNSLCSLHWKLRDCGRVPDAAAVRRFLLGWLAAVERPYAEDLAQAACDHWHLPCTASVIGPEGECTAGAVKPREEYPRENPTAPPAPCQPTPLPVGDARYLYPPRAGSLINPKIKEGAD